MKQNKNDCLLPESKHNHETKLRIFPFVTSSHRNNCEVNVNKLNSCKANQKAFSWWVGCWWESLSVTALQDAECNSTPQCCVTNTLCRVLTYLNRYPCMDVMQVQDVYEICGNQKFSTPFPSCQTCF